tara:strand:- start:2179 stop:2430 length:252 start_codon:yes stop_codon:yes gene_type:complete
MANDKYTKILQNLEFETRKGKKTGWAVDKKTGRRLTPLEVDLARHYAKKEGPTPKAAASKNRKKSLIKKVMPESKTKQSSLLK